MAINLPSRKLVSQQDASLIASPHVPRARFTGSWTRKTTFDAGLLIPILVEEIYPADQVSYNVTAYVRMSTPLFPMMDNQRIDTFFFFVPNRLLWDNFHKLLGEQAKPTDSIQYLIPQCKPTGGFGWQTNSLADHLGIPCGSALMFGGDTWVNALPFRAYNKIFADWFRDQNSDTSTLILSTDDGTDDEAEYPLRYRMKSHDYFTSALPWPQKFVSPSVPITGQAPVKGIGINAANGGFPDGAPGNGGTLVYESGTIGSTQFFGQLPAVGAAPNNWFFEGGTVNGNVPSIYADLSEASASVTISALRQAYAIQSLLERDARGGTRVIESNFTHFGVHSNDARLNRPEYIGGGSSPLMLTPIAQTAPTDSEPLGALGAAGTAVGQHRASYASTEHGFIIGLINVKSELSYQRGLHRMWSRRTRYDLMYPSTAGIGEQAIKAKELHWTGIFAQDEVVFGYQERFQELRTRYSEVTGQFRSGTAGTLDAWHLAQHFTVAPTLNHSFLADRPPMDRVLAAGALAVNQQYLADILFQRSITRALPTYGTPDTMGRF